MALNRPEITEALHGLSPSYIQSLLQKHEPTRSLRSCSKNLLAIPISKSKTHGDRSFQFAAATAWNHLPLHIRNSKTVEVFKASLKTHLFEIGYNIE